MASRRLTRNLPVQHSSVTESTDARWKRLRPDWYEGYSTSWTLPAHEAATTVASRGSRSGTTTAAADHNKTIARKDEPLVRHLRRGTTADALAALVEKGASALVDVVLKRIATTDLAILSRRSLFTCSSPSSCITSYLTHLGYGGIAIQGRWISLVPELRSHYEDQAH